ncbi:tetratricopeptide repeat protein [Streptomyces triticiradicis]|uniref:Tetratricopeptide repeat protein n=1 Tax=Streptomyces triticiradicis TaxID=2651189 RepID=A0A7J5D3T1_9ACTN|nr:tetratricopeptide repeat protein [Streptomyces triticiradicis]KAB1978605.1 tetratricopeptide repeat protein [Streptomyces triticiradicis]
MRVNVPGSRNALHLGSGTQNVQFVYQWKPAYRIEDLPTGRLPLGEERALGQPSRLLRAAHQVVPFTGRHADLAQLADWRDMDRKAAVRLVSGPGGQGKTRLATHFADLTRAEGWTVWQAVTNASGSTGEANGAATIGTGLLLVVDYAERWPKSHLEELLTEVLTRPDDVPVRVLLLSRPVGVWWESLETWITDRLDDRTASPTAVDARGLPPLAEVPDEREALFGQARDCFARHLELADEEAALVEAPADIAADDDYAQILTIHMTALASVAAQQRGDRAPANPAEASAFLLKRERAQWVELRRSPEALVSSTPEVMGRAVLVATLTHHQVRDPHGWDALHRARLADRDFDANTILDDHLKCYPSLVGQVLEPLYPDRFAEDFLGLTTPASHDSSHPVPGAVVDDWAHLAVRRLVLGRSGTDTPAPWTQHTLTVLTETARRWPHVATGQLYPLLREHPELALHATSATLVTLSELETLDLAVLEKIEPLLPDRDTNLDLGIAAIVERLARHRLATTDDPLVHARDHHHQARRFHNAGLLDKAVEAGRKSLEAWRELAAGDPAYEPEYARALANLANHLSAAGERDQARGFAEQAVSLYRRLAKESAPDHEADLATALSNLASHLSDLGEREKAAARVAEALAIRRRLAEADPDVPDPGLALCLVNHGNFLSDLGRRDEALTATEEAVDIHRRLADVNHAAHDPDLAGSLNNLGSCLSDAGRLRDALAITEEAVTVKRRLAEANPVMYRSDLALSLSNLGNRLSDIGRLADALEAEQEATDIRELLARENPAAFGAELAHSQSNLGLRLSDMGKRRAAVTVTERAVTTYRELHANYQAVFAPDLARALANYGCQLTDVGRPEEALTAGEESVAIYRELAAANEAAYELELAKTLTNLSIHLSELDRPEDALSATEEAVRILRPPTEANETAHGPSLARALNNLGLRLLALGRRDDALSAAEDAARIHRRLADSDPAAHEPDLATSLINLGNSLSALGRHEDALVAGRQATEIQCRLATHNPDAHTVDLALMLNNLGALLAETGRWKEALTATKDAVGIRSHLAKEDAPAHGPDLATSLTNIGNWLSKLGRWEEVLAVTGEAVDIQRRPAKASSAVDPADLALTLSNLGFLPSEMGQ